MYINGVEESSHTGTAGLTNVYQRYLGCGDNGGVGYSGSFEGNLDEALEFNRTLSAEEILELYNEQKKYYTLFDPQATDGLVSYWPLDESFDDLVGGNDGVCSTCPNNATGLSSGAMYFNAEADRIDTNVRPDNYEELTISMWFNRESIIAYGGLIESRTGSNWVGFIEGGTGNIRFGYTGDDGHISMYTDVLDNEDWHHITATYHQDNGGVLYVNGENVDSDIGRGLINCNADFYIGDVQPLAARYFNGELDEVLIYNRTLDASEVIDLYKAGLSQHANTNITMQTRTATSYNTSDTGLVGLWGFNENANDGLGINNGTVTGATLGNEFGIVGQGYYFDGTDDYFNVSTSGLEINSISYWIRSNSTSEIDQFVMNFESPNSAGYISNNYLVSGPEANYYINGKAKSFTMGSNLMDDGGMESGIASWSYNDGSVSGWSENTVVHNGSKSFAINDNSISNVNTRQISRGTTGGVLYKATSWVRPKRNAEDGDNMRIVVWTSGWGTEGTSPTFFSSDTSWYQRTHYFIANGTNSVAGIISTGITNQYTYVDDYSLKSVSDNTLPTGEWTHVVILLNHSINASSIDIGKYGSNYFKGSIDEVRIYNRSLSAAEIQSLYNLGSAHIEWNDWQDEGIITSGSPDFSAGYGKFVQFDYNLQTSNTDVSPYVFGFETADAADADLTPPVITISSPSTSSNTAQVDFNISSDDTLSFCKLSWDDWITNLTMDISGTIANFTNASMDEGEYNITFWCNNSVLPGGFINDTASTSLSIDLTTPAITINSPTTFWYNTQSILFNVSSSENLESCIFSINNWLTNYTMTPNGTFANFTNSSMNDGTYTAQFYCNDSANNVNNTENITFYIDYVVANGGSNKTANNLTFYNRTESSEFGYRLNTPILFMDFNKFQGNYIQDKSLFNNFGANYGATWNSSCNAFVDGCFEFDGTDDYVNIGDSDSLSFGDGTTDNMFSVSAWVKMDDATLFQILNKGENGVGGVGEEYWYGASGADNLYLRIYDQNINNYVSSYVTTAITGYEGSYIHLAVTYDGSGSSGIVHYINSVAVDMTTDSVGAYTSMHNTNADLHLGQRISHSSQYSDGQIDSLQIFDRALSATEIQELYNGSINNSNYIGKYARDGDFTSFVYYNETSSYWNVTASLADSDYRDTLTWINTTGLISYWRMDGDVTDSFGSNDGTCIECPNATIGIIDRSMLFAGWNEKEMIKVDDADSLSPLNGFSYSVWVKTEAEDDTRTILAKWSDNNVEKEYLFYYHTIDSGVVAFQLYDNENDYIGRSAPEPFGDDWHHIVVTWNGTGTAESISIYIDGVKSDDTDINSGTFGTYTNKALNLHIGSLFRLQPFSYDWSGNIDEVMLFNRTLSSTEISEIYDEQKKYYGVDLFVKHLQLDGTNDYVTVGNSTMVDGWGAITYSTWFKMDVWNDYGAIIAARGSSLNGVSPSYAASQKITGYIAADSLCTVSSSATFEVGTWYHVVLIGEAGSKARLFINGVEDSATQGDTITGTISQDDVFKIGYDDFSSARQFEGELDEIMIFNNALSDNEILELYNLKFNTKDYTHNNLVSKWEFENNYNDSIGSNEGTPTGDPLFINDIVSYWPLDGSFDDLIGGNDGTASGDIKNVTGISSGGISFDGVDDKVTISDANDLSSTSISVGAWIKKDDLSGLESFISKASGAGSGEYYFIFGDGDLFFRVVDDSTGGYKGKYFTYPDTNWHHIIATFNGTNISMYLDGVSQSLADSSSGSFTAMENTAQDVTLSYRGASYPYDGQIDEVLIYNRPLDASEVQALYKAGLTQHANANVSLQTRTASSYNTSDEELISFYTGNGDFNDSMGLYNVSGISCSNTDWGIIEEGCSFSSSSSNGASNLPQEQAKTLSLWVKPLDTSSSVAVFSGSTGSIGFTIYNTQLSIGDGDSYHNYIFTSGLEQDKWQHVSYIIDTDNDLFQYYLNGVLYHNESIISNSDLTDRYLTHGRSSSNFKSRRDEIRIYNRSLSATEIQSLYELGSAHILWNDWTNKEILVDNTTTLPTSGGNFLQARYNYQTSNTDVSPYLFNSRIVNDVEYIEGLCDTGSLRTTCLVNHTYTYTDGQIIAGNNLIIGSNGSIQNTNERETLILQFNNVTIWGQIQGGNISITSNYLTLKSSSSVITSYLGYSSNSGPGDGNTANELCGAGAGHGNTGGRSNGCSSCGGIYYGSSLNPETFGSGGSTDNIKGAPGGAGGGIITLSIENSFINNGTLVADGAESGANSDARGGGGSGGSIFITTDSLSGNGNIYSRGGTGLKQNCPAGAGAGGRIAVYYNTSTLSGTVSAAGGKSTYSTTYDGYNGTVMVYDDDDQHVTLSQGFRFQGSDGDAKEENNRTFFNTDTPTEWTFTNLTLSNGATLYFDEIDTIINITGILNNATGDTQTIDDVDISGSTNLTLYFNNNINSLTLSSTSWQTTETFGIFSFPSITGHLYLTNNSVLKTNLNISLGNLTIDSGSTLKADYLGYPSTSGPGQGGDGSLNAGGAGYGGVGGAGRYGGSGGPTYGNSQTPTYYGSGGGRDYTKGAAGGAGGGRIIITITDNFIVNGTVSTTGSIGSASGGDGVGGGGSGGSIFIVTNTIGGSGTISAIGGNGRDGGNPESGAGGGGRVAVYSETNTYTGSLLATGGTKTANGNAGQNGTITTLSCPSYTTNEYTHCLLNSTYNPSNGETISTDSNLIIGSNGSIENTAFASNIGATVIINVSGNLTIRNGGQILAGRINVDAENIDVKSGGTITTATYGYTTSNKGPGAQSNRGATHGGRGGEAPTTTPYGNPYAPTTMGSSGSTRGGGAIKLNATSITVDGTISSDAQDGGNARGGAGGSIWIIGNLLNGSGTITADGGSVNYGGGGGGRISFYNIANYAFSGSLSVAAGSGRGPFYGTIVFPENVNLNISNTITIGSGNISNYTFGNITIFNGGHLEIEGEARSNYNGDTDEWEGTAATIIAENIVINSGGSINADNLGFRGTGSDPYATMWIRGPGYYNSASTGGTHGGSGGGSTPSPNPLPTYGSIENPIALGSGSSSVGAGAVIIVANYVENNGTISADATTGGSSHGGAGGSVFITTDQFAGDGEISAIGGDPSYSGGGGGRVAVHARIINYSGTFDVRATGNRNPTAGTSQIVYNNSGYFNSTAITFSGRDPYIKLYNHYGAVSSNTVIANPDTINFENAINISNNSIIVNASAYSNLNVSSILTFYNTDSLGYTRRWPYKDGNICPSSICTEIQDNNTYIFNATGFSEYSIGEDICDSGSLSDNCLVNHTYTYTDGEIISGNNLIIGSNGSVENTTNRQTIILNFNNITIQSGGEIKGGNISITTIDLNIDGAINTNGYGYSNGNGDGAGVNATGTYVGSGGAGHGGFGGDGEDTSGGSIYGSTLKPSSYGSGGGDCNGIAGGSGGGILSLIVRNTLTLSGSILSNGENGVRGSSGRVSGAGSGGSIYITANSILGQGNISANGGNGDKESTSESGGGSAGRIAVYYNESTLNFSSAFAYGGTSLTGAENGQNGTIIFTEVDASNVYISQGFTTSDHNKNTSYYNTNNKNLWNFTNINLTLHNIDDTLINSTNIYFGEELDITKIKIGCSGKLISLNIRAINLTIGSGSVLDLSGCGYSGGNGDGAGVNATGTYVGSGGAGHGGFGGDGEDTSGGSIYGSMITPLDFGSGGGNCYGLIGGTGGSKIIINISDTFNLSGQISTNGDDGNRGSNGRASGGGSGGSILIYTKSLIGNGNLSATGGNGAVESTSESGGGAGGRIAYYTTISDSWSGDYFVAGGSGTPTATYGDNGTFYSLSCPSYMENLYTHCLLNTTYNPTNGETMSVGGNLIIGSNGSISTDQGITFTINVTGNLTMQNGSTLDLDGYAHATSPKIGSSTTIITSTFNFNDGATIYSRGGSLSAACNGCYAKTGGIITINTTTLYLNGILNVGGGSTSGWDQLGNGANSGGIIINSQNNLIINGDISGKGGYGYYAISGNNGHIGNSGYLTINNPNHNVTFNSTIDLDPRPLGGYYDSDWQNSYIDASYVKVTSTSTNQIAGTINATEVNIQGSFGANTDDQPSNGANIPNGGLITINADILNIAGYLDCSGGNNDRDNSAQYAGSGGNVVLNISTLHLNGTIDVRGGGYVEWDDLIAGGDGGTVEIYSRNNLFIGGIIYAHGGVGDASACGAINGKRGDGGKFLLTNPNINITLNGTITTRPAGTGDCFDSVWSNSEINVSVLTMNVNSTLWMNGNINAENIIIKGTLGSRSGDSWELLPQSGVLRVTTTTLNVTNTGEISARAGDYLRTSGANQDGGDAGSFYIDATNVYIEGSANIEGGDCTSGTFQGDGGDAGLLQINATNELIITGNIYGEGGSGYSSSCSATVGNRGDGGDVILISDGNTITGDIDLDRGSVGNCNNGVGGDLTINSTGYLSINSTIDQSTSGTTRLYYNTSLSLTDSTFSDSNPFITKETPNAKLEFTSTISNANSINYTEALQISTNNIYVNSSYSGLNDSAQLTLYNTDSLGLYAKAIYRNNNPCPTNICTRIQDSNTYIFNVTGFSEYSIGEGAPTISLLLPVNNTYTNALNNNFTVNISAPLKIKNATLWINNSGYNLSITQGLIQEITTQNVTLTEGVYSWHVNAFDLDNNTNSSINYTLTIDTTKPLIQFIPPTINNNWGAGENITISVNITDSYFNNITYIWNNTENTYNISDSEISQLSSAKYQFTTLQTGLADGNIYNYNVTATDKAGNTNITETRTITHDNIPPTVNITDPINGSVLGSSNITLNITANDTFLDKCWYTLNYSQPVQIVNCDFITFVPIKGIWNNITVFVNDSANNIVNDSVSFYNNNPPTIPQFLNPTDMSKHIYTYSDIWLNSTDLDNDSIQYDIQIFNLSNQLEIEYNLTTNYTEGNSSWPDGWVKIRARSYDGFDYSNYSDNITTEIIQVRMNFTLPPLHNVYYPAQSFAIQVKELEKTNWINNINVSVIGDAQNQTYQMTNDSTTWSYIYTVPNSTLPTELTIKAIATNDTTEEYNITRSIYITRPIGHAVWGPRIALFYPQESNTIANITINITTIAMGDTLLDTFSMIVTHPDGTNETLIPDSTIDDNKNYQYYRNYSFTPTVNGMYNLTYHIQDINDQEDQKKIPLHIAEKNLINISMYGFDNISLVDPFSKNVFMKNTSILINRTYGDYSLTHDVNRLKIELINTTINQTSKHSLNYFNMDESLRVNNFRILDRFRITNNITFDAANITYNYSSIQGLVGVESNLEIRKCDNMNDCSYYNTNATVDTAQNLVNGIVSNFSVFIIGENTAIETETISVPVPVIIKLIPDYHNIDINTTINVTAIGRSYANISKFVINYTDPLGNTVTLNATSYNINNVTNRFNATYNFTSRTNGTYNFVGIVTDQYDQSVNNTFNVHVKRPRIINVALPGFNNISLIDRLSKRIINRNNTLRLNITDGYYNVKGEIDELSVEVVNVSIESDILDLVEYESLTDDIDIDNFVLIDKWRLTSNTSFTYANITFNYTTHNDSIILPQNLKVYKCPSLTNCTWQNTNAVILENNSEINTIVSNFSVFVIGELVATNTETVTVTGPSAGGASSVAVADRAVALKVVPSSPLFMAQNDSVTAIVNVVNIGKVKFSELEINLTTNNGIIATLLKDSISDLDYNKSDSFKINLDSESVSGPFIVNISLTSKQPEYVAESSIIIDVYEIEKEVKINQTLYVDNIKFAYDLFKENPECIEYQDLIEQATDALENAEYQKANSLIQTAIKACKETVTSVTGEDIEFPSQTKARFPVMYIIFIIIILTLVVWLFMATWQPPQHHHKTKIKAQKQTKVKKKVTHKKSSPKKKKDVWKK